MPIGLGFQRKHRIIGYKIKYFSYVLRRRDVLQKRKTYGDKYPEKTIYVVKPDYQDGVEGLLSLLCRQAVYIDYAMNKGFIPFVDWKNFKTQYYDGLHNAWEYFFKQPSSISESEVYQCKNVYLSGWTFKNINTRGFFESNVFFDSSLHKDNSALLKRTIRFSDDVNDIVEQEAKSLEIDNCIGLYVRGTDYVQLKPSGEYVQPTVKQVILVVEKFLNKYKENSGIFLVTEDGDIYDELRNHFGEQIKIVSFDTFIRGYTGKTVLSKANVLDEDKKKRGQNYLAKMILLSRCRYLIASITQGSKISYLLNDGKYEDQYIFDLGLYK